MSGSGGYRGYEPPARAQFDCLTGTITVNLSSVDLVVLAKHSVGDILEVEFGTTGALLVINGDAETLGSISHVNTGDIMQCIKAGNHYNALITSIRIPVCTVKVRRI